MKTQTTTLRGITLLCFTIILSNIPAQNFQWAKKMGGTFREEGHAVVTDNNNNVYSIGFFNNTADFDPGTGTYNLTSAGDKDIFISKLDASGNFVWAKAIGGLGADEGNSIAVDGSGNIYITGYFSGTVDFDPGAGTYNLTSAGGRDIFIAKLDINGDFLWAKQIGSTNGDIGNALTIDGNGNVYTTGYFKGTVDFDPGAGTYNLTTAGGNDVFISKLDANGNFVWAKQFAAASTDLNNSQSIALDANNNVYTTGYFNGTTDFDPGAGVYNLNSVAGSYDIFVSKLDASGNFIWAKQLGGNNYDVGNSLTIDNNGNIYITGLFNGTADFDPGTGTYNLTSVQYNDIFISKLNTNGNFVWAKQIGGTGNQVAYSIAIDGSSNVYTTGYFKETADFDPGTGTYNLTSAGYEDVFISKLDANGNFVWAKQLAGTIDDIGFSIAIDNLGSIHTIGYFTTTIDFDPGAGTYNLTPTGIADVFILKLNQSLGIDNLAWGNITIYPNPNKGEFIIKLPKSLDASEIQITDIVGNLIYNITNINDEKHIPINLNNSAEGVYYVSIITENNEKNTFKIIKTN